MWGRSQKRKRVKKNKWRSIPEKSVWKGARYEPFDFYCPQCAVRRRVPMQPNPGNFHQFLQVGLTSIVFTMATWQWFEWKGVVVFIPIWMAFEAYYRLKMRALLACSSCGFDPFLFMRSSKEAKKEMDRFWRAKLKEKGIAYPKEPWESDEMSSGESSQESDEQTVQEGSSTPSVNA